MLGDFDSFEYAINLQNFLDNHQDTNLDIFAIAIGTQKGKEKFCNFTGFSEENLIVVSNNQIHNNLKISTGLDTGLGGWVNMLLMLSGINSLKTIKEVIRGYTGDRKAKQIYSKFDEIGVLKFLNFSGNSFNKVFGDGYLRPFELATFRLNNMNEIIQNWGDYIIHPKYLLNEMNKIGEFPWKLSFSYGRALQQSALKAWSGQSENIFIAQDELSHRAEMNKLAALGQWDIKLEDR